MTDAVETSPPASPPPSPPPPPAPSRAFVADAFRHVGATVEDVDGVLHVRLPEPDPGEAPLPASALRVATAPAPATTSDDAEDQDDDADDEEPEAPDASLGPDRDADDEVQDAEDAEQRAEARAEGQVEQGDDGTDATPEPPSAEPPGGFTIFSTPGTAEDAPVGSAHTPPSAPTSAPEPDLSAASDLARRLGTRELRLAFEAAKLGPGVDLVAPGSHVLRALEEHLAHRARRCIVERPAEHRLTLKSLSGIVRGHRGANLVLEERENVSGWDVHVVHRVRYRTLERHDTLQAVRVRMRPGAEPLVEAVAAPDEATEWTPQPRRHLPDGLLERALDLADAFSIERSRAEGERREAEARRRAQKDLSRLHAYYSGQIAELERSRRTELAATRIEELEDERALRLHELGATTRVAVEIEPLALLVVEVPLQRATLRIREKGDKADAEVEAPAKKKTKGKGKKVEPADEEPADDEAEAPAVPAPPAAEGATPTDAEAPPRAPGIEVVFDRSTNEVALGPCPSCDGAADGALERCASAHVVHARCIVPCGKCQTSACSACGSLRCRVCGEDVCVACGATCAGCGTLGCATHVGECAECKRGGCEACLRPCAGCGRKVCVEDRMAASKDAKATFCTRCAAPCPSCRKATATAELRRCARCGRKFCKDCNAPGAAACALCTGAP